MATKTQSHRKSQIIITLSAARLALGRFLSAPRVSDCWQHQSSQHLLRPPDRLSVWESAAVRDSWGTWSIHRPAPSTYQHTATKLHMNRYICACDRSSSLGNVFFFLKVKREVIIGKRCLFVPDFSRATEPEWGQTGSEVMSEELRLLSWPMIKPGEEL